MVFSPLHFRQPTSFSFMPFVFSILNIPIPANAHICEVVPVQCSTTCYFFFFFPPLSSNKSFPPIFFFFFFSPTFSSILPHPLFNSPLPSLLPPPFSFSLLPSLPLFLFLFL